jgi:hypothetical protein
MYCLKKIISILKIFLLYGEIDILISGRSGACATETTNILNKCLKLRTMMEQHRNDYDDEGFGLFKLANEESIAICIDLLENNNDIKT